MKAGILTYHNAINYGGVLQAYALQQVLRMNSINTFIIDYRSAAVEQQYKRVSLKNKKSFKQYILMNTTAFIRRKKKENFKYFVKTNIDCVPSSTICDFDSIIVGSDQVWNPLCNKGDKTYLLSELPKGIRKISYAASIGNSKNIQLYSDEYCVDYRKFLHDFDALSVREQDAAQFIYKETGKQVTTVVDPVILFGKEQWMKFVNHSSDKYIFVYNIANFSQTFVLANNISKAMGLKIKSVNKDIKGDVKFFKTKHCSNVGPDEFISLLANAEIVITDSFHATVFSILFHNNFYSVGNNNKNNTNSRLLHLLKKYGLEDRYVTSNIYRPGSDVNWNYIDSKIADDRSLSMNWINSEVVSE